MVISGMGPYSIVDLLPFKIYLELRFPFITTLLSGLALIYWCNPKTQEEHKAISYAQIMKSIILIDWILNSPMSNSLPNV